MALAEFRNRRLAPQDKRVSAECFKILHLMARLATPDGETCYT